MSKAIRVHSSCDDRGAGSFWGLCNFAGLPDRLGYSCAGPNRELEIHIVSAAIRSRLLEKERQQAARFADAHYRLRVSVAIATCIGVVAIIACLLMSGCLTASKIHRWESALLGWARKGTPECVDAAKVASKYLVNANQRLQGATGATDVQTDGEAKKLMTEAAVKCGERVP